MAKSKADNYPSSNDKFPPQIKYIVGNEGCERYSYYGMRSILALFMVNYILIEKGHATEVMHLFMGACYLLPLLGSFIADRFWGRYKTILFLSLFYCAGHAVLAAFETEMGIYVGLALIALGSGGIKPCISAFVGDQFKADQKHLLGKVYNLFYWMINFGSTFSSFLTPLTLKYFGPAIAFGIPGVLMGIATVVFWLGRKHYRHVPPSGHDEHSVWAVLRTGIKGKWGFHIPGLLVLLGLGYALYPTGLSEMSAINMALDTFKWVAYTFLSWCAVWIIFNLATGHFMGDIKKNHPKERVEEFVAAMQVAKIFACISVFWALFDQHASTWVLQAEQMQRMVKIGSWEFEILSSQVSTLNPVFVLCLIPIFSIYIYPAFDKFYPMTPLRRMTWGMILAGFAYSTVAFIQYPMDNGQSMHVAWQAVPYFFMTVAEILVSITGLEFAYTQAPKSIKSTIMSFWLLTVFIGNIITVYVVKLSPFPLNSGNFFMSFAVMMLAAGLIFAVIAKYHKVKDYLDK